LRVPGIIARYPKKLRVNNPLLQWHTCCHQYEASQGGEDEMNMTNLDAETNPLLAKLSIKPEDQS
jgi:hypothetical protein